MRPKSKRHALTSETVSALAAVGASGVSTGWRYMHAVLTPVRDATVALTYTGRHRHQTNLQAPRLSSRPMMLCRVDGTHHSLLPGTLHWEYFSYKKAA